MWGSIECNGPLQKGGMQIYYYVIRREFRPKNRLFQRVSGRVRKTSIIPCEPRAHVN